MSALNQNRVAGLASQIQPLKQAMNMVQSAANPQMMMNQLMQSNPAYSQVQQLIQQHNGDARQAFYSLANQMGVDPNEIINALK